MSRLLLPQAAFLQLRNHSLAIFIRDDLIFESVSKACFADTIAMNANDDSWLSYYTHYTYHMYKFVR